MRWKVVKGVRQYSTINVPAACRSWCVFRNVRKLVHENGQNFCRKRGELEHASGTVRVFIPAVYNAVTSPALFFYPSWTQG